MTRRFSALLAVLAAGPVGPAAPPRAPAPTPVIRLYTLDCGHIDVLDMAYFSDTGEHAGERGALAVPCFLVRHPKGDLLWDTGLGDRLAALPNGQAVGDIARFRVPVTLASQLERLGVAPSAVRYVAFSHLHVDHVGNAAAFGTATWLMNRAELAATLGTPTPVGVDPALIPAHARERTVTLDGDYDVFGDGSVRILRAPGHTPGHQVLLVRLARTGPVLLSGDLWHTRENYERSLVPPINASRAETLASIDRVRRVLQNTRARLVVQHDPHDVQALPAFPDFLE